MRLPSRPEIHRLKALCLGKARTEQEESQVFVDQIRKHILACQVIAVSQEDRILLSSPISQLGCID